MPSLENWGGRLKSLLWAMLIIFPRQCLTRISNLAINVHYFVLIDHLYKVLSERTIHCIFLVHILCIAFCACTVPRHWYSVGVCMLNAITLP